MTMMIIYEWPCTSHNPLYIRNSEHNSANLWNVETCNRRLWKRLMLSRSFPLAEQKVLNHLEDKLGTSTIFKKDHKKYVIVKKFSFLILLPWMKNFKM